MTPLVAFAVLIAAVTHASWNAIAHAIKDQLVSFTLISGGGLLIGAAAALFVPFPAAGAGRIYWSRPGSMWRTCCC